MALLVFILYIWIQSLWLYITWFMRCTQTSELWYLFTAFCKWNYSKFPLNFTRFENKNKYLYAMFSNNCTLLHRWRDNLKIVNKYRKSRLYFLGIKTTKLCRVYQKWPISHERFLQLQWNSLCLDGFFGCDVQSALGLTYSGFSC